MAANSTREPTISLRASAAFCALIDRAAEALGKSRTVFMLDAAAEKAQQVLLDRTVLALNAESFSEFARLLEAPLAEPKRVKKLLQRKTPWE